VAIEDILFKNRDGKRQIMKKTQHEIFNLIANREHPRNTICCHTRYGKSMTIAQAVLFRVVFHPETWIFIGPKKEQAEILMNHLIQHLFDSSKFYSQLDVDIPIERLKKKERKDRLTFRRGGEVYVLSAQATNAHNLGALLGHGSANIIMDEAPLIPDPVEAMIFRMLANSADNFLLKVGNAFENNHFRRSFHDDAYRKIIVDCYKGLEESKVLPYDEGYLTQSMIDEVGDRPFFEQLWECKFSEGSVTDERGYTPIITEKELLASFDRFDKLDKKIDTIPTIGNDVGAGGDYSVHYARWPKFGRRIDRNKDRDTMSQVARIRKFRDEFKVDEDYPYYVIDKIGIGTGVVDRCLELDIPVVGFVAGSNAQDTERFSNAKSEAYWDLAQWVKKNAVERDKDLLQQLPEIRYKEDSERRVKIEPKQDYVKRMGHSPDDAEALMLTFAPREPEPELMIL